MDKIEVEILQTFDRYPETGPVETFPAGWTLEVDAATAEAWISKGLARATAPSTPPAKPTPST